MPEYIRPLKKAHLPSACHGQAVEIDAFDANRSNVLLKYASARRFLARRSAELTTKPCIWDLFDRPDKRVFSTS